MAAGAEVDLVSDKVLVRVPGHDVACGIACRPLADVTAMLVAGLASDVGKMLGVMGENRLVCRVIEDR